MNNKEPLVEKCTSDKICTLLRDRCEEPTYSGKGFVLSFVVQRQRRTNVLYGVRYKQDKADAGAMINYCPFCGGSPGLHSMVKKS
ncbi:MAG TPA: hypothetical protein PLR50_03010 [Candidatus Rifleibacterium sp.]|nr:hypothetical protein [Candidatus Rifleibacterium sp.]HPW57647.1 hypothetical protein [Candidatus Rifleibacterium sp.]HQB82439.1 hypothetical protein [Candidatus Rifleibacterium sp.]